MAVPPWSRFQTENYGYDFVLAATCHVLFLIAVPTTEQHHDKQSTNPLAGKVVIMGVSTKSPKTFKVQAAKLNFDK